MKTYDIHGRLTATTDKLGRRTHYLLEDETGNTVQMIAPDGKQTAYEYNNQGLRSAVILPNGESLRYDYTDKGQLRVATDPLGHTTRYSYTATGRLFQIEDAVGGKKVITPIICMMNGDKPFRLKEKKGYLSLGDMMH